MRTTYLGFCFGSDTVHSGEEMDWSQTKMYLLQW